MKDKGNRLRNLHEVGYSVFYLFMLMCSSEKPTGCWTDLWCVPAKRQVMTLHLDYLCSSVNLKDTLQSIRVD